MPLLLRPWNPVKGDLLVQCLPISPFSQSLSGGGSLSRVKYTLGAPLLPPWPHRKEERLPQGKISTCFAHFTYILGPGVTLLIGQRFPFWLHLSSDSASQLDQLDNHGPHSKSKHITLWTPICAPHLSPQARALPFFGPLPPTPATI